MLSKYSRRNFKFRPSRGWQIASWFTKRRGDHTQAGTWATESNRIGPWSTEGGSCVSLVITLLHITMRGHFEKGSKHCDIPCTTNKFLCFYFCFTPAPVSSCFSVTSIWVWMLFNFIKAPLLLIPVLCLRPRFSQLGVQLRSTVSHPWYFGSVVGLSPIVLSRETVV